MSLENDIQTTLSAVSQATGGVFHDTAPQNTPAPYIVWSLISRTANNNFKGLSNLQQARVQIDSYAKSQQSRYDLEAAATTAMLASALSIIKISEQHIFEADVRLFRAQSDFSVWSL